MNHLSLKTNVRNSKKRLRNSISIRTRQTRLLHKKINVTMSLKKLRKIIHSMLSPTQIIVTYLKLTIVTDLNLTKKKQSAKKLRKMLPRLNQSNSQRRRSVEVIATSTYFSLLS